VKKRTSGILNNLNNLNKNVIEIGMKVLKDNEELYLSEVSITREED